MNILLTSFEPFGTRQVNASTQACGRIPSHWNGHHVERVIFPVQYHIESSLNSIDLSRYDLIVLTGEAGLRHGFSAERFALNIADATLPDNQGVLLRNTVLIDNAPPAYETQVDLTKWKNSLSDVVFDISVFAGAFLCNDVYYRVLHTVQKNIPVVFIHVPVMGSEDLESFQNQFEKILLALFNIVESK